MLEKRWWCSIWVMVARSSRDCRNSATRMPRLCWYENSDVRISKMAWGESRADVGHPCPLALPGATPPHRGPGPGCVADKHSGCGDMMRAQDLGPLDRTWVGLSAQLLGRGQVVSRSPGWTPTFVWKVGNGSHSQPSPCPGHQPSLVPGGGQ